MEVDFVSLTVDHFILKIGERFVGDDSEVEAEFELPFAIERRESFFEISRDKGVDVKNEMLDF